MYTFTMNPLEEIIAAQIKKEGPITFEAFMEMVLYYPGLGYYSSPGTATIGREGDFYTSPHLHPIFGAMLGKQLMEMWMIMGRPSVFHAVEIGAGIGYLCNDIFDYLSNPLEDSIDRQDKRIFLQSLKYVIVEPYVHFQDRQKKLLKGLLINPPSAHLATSPDSKKKMNSSLSIEWVQSLKELKHSITGCILSNELLDAFPVHLIEMEDELKEVYIMHDGKEFKETLNIISTEDIVHYIKAFAIEMRSGYRTEINLKIRDWLRRVSDILSEGFLLTVDYGYSTREYYSDDRTRGTLLCYHKHVLNENPFQNIGEQDITAHVNFSSLKKWGDDLGLKALGYCPQGTYLTASGINETITELYSGSPDYLSEVSKIKGLILPQGMGESHSVMVQYKGDGTPELRGFSMRNLADNL